MRSSTMVTAAFAATAFATPMKRDVDVDTVVDIVYVTDIVTETAGATSAPVSTTTVAPTVIANTHFAHSHHWSPSSSQESTSTSAESAYVPSSTLVASPSSSAVSSIVVSSPSSIVSVAPSSASSVSVVSSVASSASVAASTTDSAVTSVNTASSPTTSVITAGGAMPSDYVDLTLLHHNVHRSNHSATDVTWDDDLASTAQSIAESCVYAHNVTASGGGYGQNIAAGVSPYDIGSVITDLFYNGEVNWFDGIYGEASPDMTNFEHWGHFSQIVWNTTTKIGCYTMNCTNSAGDAYLSNVGSDVAPYFTVCNYESPGNYAGEYYDVNEPLGAASIDGSYTG